MDLRAARNQLPPLRLLAPQPRESMPPRPVPDMRRIRVRKTPQETRQDLLPRTRHCRGVGAQKDLLFTTSSHLEQGGVMTLLLTIPDMLHTRARAALPARVPASARLAGRRATSPHTFGTRPRCYVPLKFGLKYSRVGVEGQLITSCACPRVGSQHVRRGGTATARPPTTRASPYTHHARPAPQELPRKSP